MNFYCAAAQCGCFTDNEGDGDSSRPLPKFKGSSQIAEFPWDSWDVPPDVRSRAPNPELQSGCKQLVEDVSTEASVFSPRLLVSSLLYELSAKFNFRKLMAVLFPRLQGAPLSSSAAVSH